MVNKVTNAEHELLKRTLTRVKEDNVKLLTVARYYAADESFKKVFKMIPNFGELARKTIKELHEVC